MKLNQLHDNQGATHSKKRIGRGIGSGKGKTAGKGHKGQKARAGGNIRLGFEGGQSPLYRRLPMRGFNNAMFATEYVIINLGQIQTLVEAGKLAEGQEVSIITLQEAGFTKKTKDGLKVLGNGELKAKLNITAAAWSQAAEKKITKAGGKLTSAKA